MIKINRQSFTSLVFLIAAFLMLSKNCMSAESFDPFAKARKRLFGVDRLPPELQVEISREALPSILMVAQGQRDGDGKSKILGFMEHSAIEKLILPPLMPGSSIRYASTSIEVIRAIGANTVEVKIFFGVSSSMVKYSNNYFFRKSEDMWNHLRIWKFCGHIEVDCEKIVN
jgi:hypothetical protein